MSFAHPEVYRICQRCGHGWWAEKWTKLDTSPPLTAPGLTRRSQALARQTIHQDHLAKHNKWKECGKCGSVKVKSFGGPPTIPTSPAPIPVVPQPVVPKPVPRRELKPVVRKEPKQRRKIQIKRKGKPPIRPSSPPPGWHPDPTGATTGLRYWDGSRWTEWIAPVPGGFRGGEVSRDELK